MLYKKLMPDFSFEDDRGFLTQLVHGGYSQINVLYSKRGVKRGEHYHKLCHEAFFVVSGSVLTELSRDEISEKVTFNKGDFFEIYPYVIHSMIFNEDCVLVAMYDRCVEMDDGTKDIYSVD